MRSPKQFLQSRNEYHKKHWNQHPIINDEWWAKEMKEYAEYYHKEKLKSTHLIDINNIIPNDTEIALQGKKYSDTYGLSFTSTEVLQNWGFQAGVNWLINKIKNNRS